MPSVSITHIDGFLDQDVWFPVKYGGKIYYIGYQPINPIDNTSCIVIDINTKDVYFIDVRDSEAYNARTRLIEYTLKGHKVVFRVVYGLSGTNKIRCSEVTVDLDAMTGSWISVWEAQDTDFPSGVNFNKGQVLSRKLILGALPDKPYIWYIDGRTGEIEDKWDTGFGSYNPRISGKAIALGGGLKVLCGRHLSGDPHYVLDVYAKTISSIANSEVDNDSPDPLILNPLYTNSKLLFPSTSCHVVDGLANIVWFDEDFNLLGKTDMSVIYSSCKTDGGTLLGLTPDGYIAMLVQINDNHRNYASEWTLRYLEIDPTDWSIKRNDILYRSTDSNNRPLCIGQAHAYGDRLGLPIVDRENKKVYMTSSWIIDGNKKGAFLEFDISDIDIDEWNMFNWLI